MRRVLTLTVLLTAGFLGSGCSYNTFTAQEEAIKGQWAQVENQLQRRSDLIPNLVETVKGFAAQEQAVFGAVADARAGMAGASTPAQQIEAGTEHRLSTERMRYNERVQAYKTMRRQFPSNITASLFNFDEYPYYEIPDSARVTPRVNFGG